MAGATPSHMEPDSISPPAATPAPPAAAAATALPSPAATWSRSGARPKGSAPNLPLNLPAHQPLLTDMTRGDHPISSQQNRQLGKSSSFRRRLLMEAVNRRSGDLPCPQVPEKQPPELDHSRTSGALAAAADVPSSTTTSVAAAPALSHTASNKAPTPLFPPTALIVGDSIVRHIRFANAATHCFPGATTADILEKLPGLLESAPPTITRIIVLECDTCHCVVLVGTAWVK